MTIVLAAIAGLGFALAGLAGVFGITIGGPVRAVAIAVASGILLATSFVELFPEALEVAGHERAAFGFLVGFALLYVIEVVTRGHTHHDAHDAGEHAGCVPPRGAAPEGHAHSHSHDHGAGEDGAAADVHHHPVFPFIVGLAAHNLSDGFAIGASHDLSSDGGGAVAIGVLVHQLPVGISFAAVLAVSMASRRFVARAAIGLGAAIVVGAVLETVLPAMSDATMATLAAGVAGALTYVGAGHLLPEAHREHASRTIAIAFPASLLATAWLFLQLHHD